MDNFEQRKVMAVAELGTRLQAAGIDTASWGTGETKTVEHLFQEIEDGETVLVEGEAGELLRQVVVGGADVYYTSPDGKTFRLKEEKQVFKDGRERRRDLGRAVSEKMKPGENPPEAMVRGMQEELGIEGDVRLEASETDEETKDSPSYPGLRSKYVTHKFRAELTDDQYKPEGYIEQQEDKSTYFVWEEVV